MLFQTPEFGLLLIATLVAFYALARGHRLSVLAIASLIFYAASGLLDFALLMATILVSYGLSKRVQPGGQKWPIYAGIIMLMGALAYFKYSDFLYDSLNGALTNTVYFGRPSFLNTVLPLGISFYSFQVVAYLVDIYRGRADHARSLWEYLTFVMFFPQLIAGPIMRGAEYLGQLRDLKGGTWSDFRAGGMLVLTGLVKKVVIADTLARFVDARFAAESFSQPEAWIAAALFGFQIYFDFSGYVDMALGLARMFGLKLRQNFFTPYLSRNPSEFWTRWHVTLSEWFRDYVYIPLGGNRAGRGREAFNLLVVMALAGLWHGAGWTFVMWGVIHGVYLVAYRFWPVEGLKRMVPLRPGLRDGVFRLLAVALMFNLVMLAWIPFRAPDLATSMEMFRALIAFPGVGEWISEAKWIIAIGALFVLHVAEHEARNNLPRTYRVWSRVPSAARGTAYAAVVIVTVALSGGQQSFIYFRF